jgi:hypothetical protein
VIKNTLTKFVLDAIQVTVSEDQMCTLEEFHSVQQNWVEHFHNAVENANHSPKPLTGFSAVEVHWPNTPEVAS